MKFYEAKELVDRANKVLAELPGDFKKQDKEEGTQNAQMWEGMLKMMRDQNENMMKMIAGINQ